MGKKLSSLFTTRISDRIFGSFRKALQVINDNGGDIINVGMTARQTSKRTYYFRLSVCKTDIIKKALEDSGFEVSDAMD